MGNFLYNVDKSREEWLKKPNPISSRARYLNANANLNSSLVINQEPISEPIQNSDMYPKANENINAVQEPISDK